MVNSFIEWIKKKKSDFTSDHIPLQELVSSPPTPTRESTSSSPNSQDSLKDSFSIPNHVAESSLSSTKSQKQSDKSDKWKRTVNYVLILLADMMVTMTFMAISPFFPNEARDKGASPLVTSAIISISPLFVVITSPVMGYTLNLVGLKITTCVALLLVGSSCVLFGFLAYIHISWLFILLAFLLRIMDGIGTALYMTASFTLVPSLYPNNTATALGLFEVFGGIGSVLGAPVGGILYHIGGFKLPLIVLGIPTLVMIIPCALLMKNLEDVKKEKKLPPKKLILTVVTDVIFLLLLLTMILLITAVTFLLPTLEPYLTDKLHMKPIHVALSFLIITATVFFSSIPSAVISDKLGHYTYFHVAGLMLIASGYFIISIPYFTRVPEYWYIAVGFVMIGLGGGSGMVPILPNMLIRAKKYVKTEEEKQAIAPFISGVSSAALSLGEFIGPLLGGLFYTYLSFPLTALVYAEIILAQAILLLAVGLIDQYV